MPVSSSISSSEEVPDARARLAIHGLAFVAILFALDHLVGFGLSALLATIRTGEGSGQANAALAARDADVIFFGSSRCRQHFDPATFEEETGLRGYNAGANGQGIVYAELLSAVMLARGSRARAFVLHVDAQDLFEPHVARASVLLPFADEADAIVGRLSEEDRWLRVKMLSASYAFNSMALPILRNAALPRRDNPTGFEPLERPRGGVGEREAGEDTPAEVAAELRRRVSPRARAVLSAFIRRARDARVEPVFVTAPLSLGVAGPEPVSARDARRIRGQRLLDDIAEEEGVAYVALDERSHPELDDASLFNDPGHMNRRGAERLTRLLATARRWTGGGSAGAL